MDVRTESRLNHSNGQDYGVTKMKEKDIESKTLEIPLKIFLCADHVILL